MSPTVAYGPPVITIDVEDWPQSTWDQTLPITDRAAVNTRRVLGLLRETGVRATMFVLGKFAERFPEVVRQIHAEGHEIACHGYGHVPITGQSRQDFLDDVLRAKDLLEQTVGERVRGYRAPDFTIVSKTLWALEALGEAGFEYDSSIVPVRLARYGIPEWPVTPVQLRFGTGGTMMEVPLATFRCLGKNWPVGGGGYHRLFPGFVSRFLARKVLGSGPFVFYCHPYEFDRRELREIPLSLPLRVRFHQGAGRRWFEQRFKSFVKRFGGQRMQDLLSSRRWPEFDLHTFTRKSSSNSIPDLRLSSIRES